MRYVTGFLSTIFTKSLLTGGVTQYNYIVSGLSNHILYITQYPSNYDLALICFNECQSKSTSERTLTTY